MTDISVDKIATVYFVQTARIYTKIIQKWVKRLRFCALMLLLLLLLLLLILLYYHCYYYYCYCYC